MISGNEMTEVFEGSKNVYASSQRINSEIIINSSSDSGVDGVIVRNATKSYGSGRNKCDVLQDLNMNVNKGKIYGLLGASGCGKTTLLSCLVALRTLNSGKIQVLGHEPGSLKSGIPGPQVGYMPQELALYGDFTIHETLTYFGRIYKLKPTFVKSQLKFLSELLDLPPSDRLIKTLSGGQQRRVSFAVALFHDPELLILDEPTVGVDSVLRKSIWNHLLRVAVDHGRTVIVTTHYIEEARQAHKIGMMRCGRLLVEDSPENLLRNHNLLTLEDVFLKLSRNQENPVVASSSASLSSIELDPNTKAQSQEYTEENINRVPISNVDHQWDKNEIPLSTAGGSADNQPEHSCVAETNTIRNREIRSSFLSEKFQKLRRTLPSPYRIGVLLRKNYLVSFRFTVLFLVSFLLPAIQSFNFNLFIGKDLTDLKMAIVNDEIDVNEGRICNNASDCSYSMLSCRYLRYIKENIIQVPYGNLSEALEAGRNGYVWGVIHFSHNFSEGFEIWELEGNEENAIGKQISITMDSSNQQVDAFLKKWLGEAYGDFIKGFMVACGHDPLAGSIPIEFLDPVYGQKDTPFSEFRAPSFIITIIYSCSLYLISGAFIRERMTGLVDRNLVAGVQMNEIFISYLGKESITVACQTALVYVVFILICKVPCLGSVTLALFITFLQGFAGLCFGMLIASLFDSTNGVIYVTQSCFLPLLLLGGVLWPIEGMPTYLQYVAYSAIPTTYAIRSLRSVMSRGWGLEHPEIYAGIVSSFAWIFGVLIICCVVLRLRKNSD